jgi:hypothetical protein
MALATRPILQNQLSVSKYFDVRLQLVNVCLDRKSSVIEVTETAHKSVDQVGTGPAGLVLAFVLAINGVQVRLIDREPRCCVGSKGAGIMVRRACQGRLSCAEGLR